MPEVDKVVPWEQ